MRVLERGASSVVAAATVGVAIILAVLVVDVALLVSQRIRVAGAADAAALAAAPLTFRAYGSAAGPTAEAARFAAANGAVLVRCDCPVDGTLRPRTVRVVVAAVVELLVFGTQRVTASSAATFSPARLTSSRAPPATR